MINDNKIADDKIKDLNLNEIKKYYKIDFVFDIKDYDTLNKYFDIIYLYNNK